MLQCFIQVSIGRPWGNLQKPHGASGACAISMAQDVVSPDKTNVLPSSEFHDDLMFERAVGSNGTGPISSIAETNPDALLDGFAATDMGNAHRLVKHHGALIRYVPGWDFLVWSGSRWKKDDTEGSIRIGKDTVRSMIVDAADHLKYWASEKIEVLKAKALLKHAERSSSMGRLKAMVEASRSEKGVVMRNNDFDTDLMLLNADNCTIDLRTGEAQVHEPSHYITKKTPAIYDPEAKCPTWEMFLLDVFQTPELVSYIQRVLGYCITGETREQCAFIFHGTGSNGKSTLLQTVLRVLGPDYASQLNSSTLVEHREGSSANNDVAALQGIRMVSCIEVGSGRRLNEELVKQFTGQDRIRARFLYEESFEFEPQFKLIIAANHKPEIRGQDYGMWRRVRLIPFKRTFKETEKDVLLPQRLAAESSGILRWLVEGAKQWLDHGLVTPEVVKEATLEYKDEMNEIGDFIGTTFAGPDLSCGATEIYTAYCRYMEGRGKPMTQTAFGRRLDDLGFVSAKQRGIRVRLGISMLPPSKTLNTFDEHLT